VSEVIRLYTDASLLAYAMTAELGPWRWKRGERRKCSSGRDSIPTWQLIHWYGDMWAQ